MGPPRIWWPCAAAAVAAAAAVGALRLWRRFARGVPRGLQAYAREAAVAAAAARACGEAIIQARHLHVAWKDADGVDPCTQTDRDNEALVYASLKEAFPGHAIIGEEASADAGAIPQISDAPTWVVDPIDGTQNFVHGLPLSCVSIGLVVHGKPTVGVVFDPHRDEMFVAVRGQGAFLNGSRLPRLQQTPQPTRVTEAMVLTDAGYERGAGVGPIVRFYEMLLRNKVRAVRILGSAVLSLVYVAAGRASAFVIGFADGDSPKPWDWCAAAVLVHELGAEIRMLDNRRNPPGDSAKAPTGGEDFDLFSTSCVCAVSTQLADELAEFARQVRA
ncbi:hypothetical protein M885DRAFT_505616 [Pelagophyceae sp. CCMP2097]|nr:hypothetical protein M885DRAFT_505616 [Pelagophyceae sp. CCMP2097]